MLYNYYFYILNKYFMGAQASKNKIFSFGEEKYN